MGCFFKGQINTGRQDHGPSTGIFRVPGRELSARYEGNVDRIRSNSSLYGGLPGQQPYEFLEKGLMDPEEGFSKGVYEYEDERQTDRKRFGR